jgi:hypothetical protein
MRINVGPSAAVSESGKRAIEVLVAPELDPCFWPFPRSGVPSAWYGHVSFAQWLLPLCAPRILVELGTHNGVSYTAFCEAVLRAQLETRCYAVDTWAGDEHAGYYGEDVYLDFSAFHDRNFAGFSTLLRTTFEAALEYFDDRSIDLLHIDGLHTYEAVRADFEQWKPKLSDRAVVLFHDTNVRERGFGVWKLWAELREAYPGFEFFHASGLGVLVYGAHAPPPLRSIAGGSERNLNCMRRRFATLGDRYVLGYQFETAYRERLSLKDALFETNTQLEEFQHRCAELRSAYDEAMLDAKEQERLRQIQEQVTVEHGLTRRRLIRANADLQIMWRKLGSAQAECASLEANYAALDAEYTAFRAMARSEADQSALRVQRLSAEAEWLRASTSWRVTWPLRVAKRRAVLLGKRGRLIAKAAASLGAKARSVVALARPIGRQLRRGDAQRPVSSAPIVRQDDTCPPAVPTVEPAGVIGLVQSLPDDPYRRWIRRFDLLTSDDIADIRKITEPVDTPALLVICSVGDFDLDLAERFSESLRSQIYERWRAVLVTKGEANSKGPSLENRCAKDPRISFSAAGDQQLVLNAGECLVLVEGAILREHALAMLAYAAVEGAQLVYADHDTIDGAGSRSNPFFKPDFSPSLLGYVDYISGCVLLRPEPSQVNALLRAVTLGDNPKAALIEYARTLPRDRVVHLPFILSHNARSNASPCPGYCSNGHEGDRTEETPLVSIIIPTRDKLGFLARCIDSIFERTDYDMTKVEIIIIDNGSSEPVTYAWLQQGVDSGRFRVIRDPRPFNFARLNNDAARASSNEIILFLNNDTEVRDPRWLRKMATLAAQPGIGVVGTKLLYEDGTVQHGGVIVGFGGVAAHIDVGMLAETGGYQGISRATREISAVTGA